MGLEPPRSLELATQMLSADKHATKQRRPKPPKPTKPPKPSKPPVKRATAAAAKKPRKRRKKPVDPYHNIRRFQWEPGVSGNPAGRPKKPMVVSDAMRDILSGTEVKLVFVVNGRTKSFEISADKNLAYGVAAVAIQQALSGDIRAIKEVCDRVQGKPPLALRLGHDTGPETPLSDDVLSEMADILESNAKAKAR